MLIAKAILDRKNENKSVVVDDFLGAEDSLKVIKASMVSRLSQASFQNMSKVKRCLQ